MNEAISLDITTLDLPMHCLWGRDQEDKEKKCRDIDCNFCEHFARRGWIP